MRRSSLHDNDLGADVDAGGEVDHSVVQSTLGLEHRLHIVVETVFAWPGLGQTAVQAIERQDLVLLQARDVVEAIRLRATRLMVIRGSSMNGCAPTLQSFGTTNQMVPVFGPSPNTTTSVPSVGLPKSLVRTKLA